MFSPLKLYKITRKGQILGFKNPEEKPSFTQGKRWEHIEEIARRTSSVVGPGAYNTNYTTNSGLSSKIVKESYIESFSEWKYLYVGNAIVKLEKYQPRCISPNTSYMNTTSQTSRRDRVCSRKTKEREIIHSDQVPIENFAYLIPIKMNNGIEDFMMHCPPMEYKIDPVRRRREQQTEQ